MSLRGRQVIDRIKKGVSHWLTLPCPPYGNTDYWDGVYKSLGPNDVYEWGCLTLEEHLLEHKYRLLQQIRSGKLVEGDDGLWETLVPTTFGESMGVHPLESDKPIVLLGCGNSKLAEDMALHQWKGPLLQVDVASRVLETMTQRCEPFVREGVMKFVQDDATKLSTFQANAAAAVIDKGLVDALFCANHCDQIQNVMTSVHRVLQPGAIFCIFSFSQPEYILPRLLSTKPSREGQELWGDIQVRELDTILMYRCQKNDETTKLRLRPFKQRNQTKRQ